MTENSKDTKKDTQKSETKTTANEPRKILVNAQYTKDLSFENPNAPQNFSELKEPPKIDVSVDIEVKKIQDSAFEVTLLTNVKASANDKSLFLIELAYSGVFTVEVPDNEREPVLMVYCPNLLFPYSRRIISDITRDAGFPPLMLDPIDFANLYHQHKISKKDQKTAGAID